MYGEIVDGVTQTHCNDTRSGASVKSELNYSQNVGSKKGALEVVGGQALVAVTKRIECWNPFEI